MLRLPGSMSSQPHWLQAFSRSPIGHSKKHKKKKKKKNTQKPGQTRATYPMLETSLTGIRVSPRALGPFIVRSHRQSCDPMVWSGVSGEPASPGLARSLKQRLLIELALLGPHSPHLYQNNLSVGGRERKKKYVGRLLLAVNVREMMKVRMKSIVEKVILTQRRRRFRRSDEL